MSTPLASIVVLTCDGPASEEAAMALGVTHQAVSGRLNRARKKLRAALEGRDGHDLA